MSTSSSRGSISWKRRSSSCSNRSCPLVLPVTSRPRQISWTRHMAGRKAQLPAPQTCPPEHQTTLPIPTSPHLMLGAASPLSKKREVKLTQCGLLCLYFSSLCDGTREYCWWYFIAQQDEKIHRPHSGWALHTTGKSPCLDPQQDCCFTVAAGWRPVLSRAVCSCHL